MQTVYIYVSHKSPFFDQYVTFFLFNIENKYRWEQVVIYRVSGYRDNIKSRIIIEPN